MSSQPEVSPIIHQEPKTQLQLIRNPKVLQLAVRFMPTLEVATQGLDAELKLLGFSRGQRGSSLLDLKVAALRGTEFFLQTGLAANFLRASADGELKRIFVAFPVSMGSEERPEGASSGIKGPHATVLNIDAGLSAKFKTEGISFQARALNIQGETNEFAGLRFVAELLGGTRVELTARLKLNFFSAGAVSMGFGQFALANPETGNVIVLME